MNTDTQYAQMSSRGPWYAAAVKANFILPHRKGASSIYSTSELQDQLASQYQKIDPKFQPPTDRTVRRWVTEQRFLPENAIRDGLMNSIDVMPQLRTILHSGNVNVGMGQRQMSGSLAFESKNAGNENDSGSLGDLTGALVCLGIAAFAIWKRNGGGASSRQQGARTASRRSRRRLVGPRRQRTAGYDR